jgi:RNA polymerase sigma-70 factor (ECF subfamily)
MQDNKLVKALVLNAQLGNNSAFERLYQLTIESVYALILRLAGAPSNSEKLSIKTYVNAWQQISEKDESISILDWLKKIAVETYLSDSLNDTESSEQAGTDKKVIDETLEKIYDEYPLEKYLQELDHRSKLIFILHDIENLSYDEISEFLTISVEEIKSLLVNSREKLISVLES